MISLKMLIVEGRYDAMVGKLSRELLQIIKDSLSATQDPRGEYNGIKIHYEQGETVPQIDADQKHIYSTSVENFDIGLEFNLALRIQWIDGFKDYVRGADAYIQQAEFADDADEEPYIEIRFALDPADTPRIFSSVAMDLRDSLRHEIEHTTQTGWNVKPGKYIPSDQDLRAKINSGERPAREYFLLPMEMPAMIHGLYLKAKKSRKPFRDVASNYLENFFYMNNVYGEPMLTPKDRDIILAKWKEYLPKLGMKGKL